MGHEPRSVALSGRSALAHPVRAFATFSNAHTKSLFCVPSGSRGLPNMHNSSPRNMAFLGARSGRPCTTSPRVLSRASLFASPRPKSQQRRETPQRDREAWAAVLRGDKREAAGERPWAARPTTTSPRCSSAFRNSPVRSSSDSQLVCHLRSVDTSHSLSRVSY